MYALILLGLALSGLGQAAWAQTILFNPYDYDGARIEVHPTETRLQDHLPFIREISGLTCHAGYCEASFITDRHGGSQGRLHIDMRSGVATPNIWAGPGIAAQFDLPRERCIFMMQDGKPQSYQCVVVKILRYDTQSSNAREVVE